MPPRIRHTSQIVNAVGSRDDGTGKPFLRVASLAPMLLPVNYLNAVYKPLKCCV